MIRISRYINVLEAAASYLVASSFRTPVMWGMPPAIGVELTNHCNLKCPECPSGSGTMKRERGYMDIDLFRKLVEETRSSLLHINLYFQGEPTMHPGFSDFLEESRDIHSTISSNGHFLTEENSDRIMRSGLSELIISIDGLDQGTYSAYRVNGRIAKVIEGIINISEAKRRTRSRTKIILQLLVNKYNEKQIPAIRKLALETGCEFTLKSMQVTNLHSAAAWLPVDRKYRRYDQVDGGYRIRSSFRRRCARLWLNPVITWNGDVIPCCFDKDADHIMGNIREESFSSIWKGKKFSQFRSELLSGREKIAICRNCTSGLKQ